MKAQLHINTNNLKLCTNNSGFVFLQNISNANSSFQWQDSSATGWNNISNFSNFIGTTNDTLFLFNVTSALNNLKVRCIVDSAALGTKKDTTKASLITIYSPIISPKLSQSKIICRSVSSDTLRISQLATGADNNFIYQWQSAVGNTNSFNIIPDADSTLLIINPSLMDTATWFRVIATSAFGCGIKFSDTIKIQVLQNYIPTIISNNQTVCFNTKPSKLSSNGGAKGVDGRFTYQWQESSNSVVWADVVNENDTDLVFNQGLISSKFFRLKIISTAGCGTWFSNSIFIEVLPQIIKPIISGNQSVCFESIPDTLKMLQFASGANGNFTYQWQESNNGLTYSNILGKTSASLVLASGGTTKFYRIAAHNNCDTVFSDSVRVIVFPTLNAGEIKNNQAICYNTIPQVLSFQNSPSGGGGNYTYQWQFSTDSLNYFDIPSATNILYQPSVLQNTTWYRLKVSSTFGCGLKFTNKIKILVYNNFIPASIGNSQTVCYNNSTNDSLRIITPASGANGIYTYQWQSSTDSFVWSNIPSQTGKAFKPGNLTVTHYYRLITISNCGAFQSNAISIKVLPKINKARINASQIICYNASADTLRLIQFATGGNGVFNYQWQSSSDGITWQNITGQTGIKFRPVNLKQTTFYRIAALSGFGCSAVYSDSIRIFVYDEFKAGQISSNQIVCFEAENDTLRFTTTPTGAGNIFALQWQVSFDSILFTNIIGADDPIYKAPISDVTKYYRVRVTSSNGCGVLFTNIIRIKVYDKFVGASISGNDTICKDSIPNLLVASKLPTGGNNVYAYQWQTSINEIDWLNIPGAINANYQPTVLNVTTYYRLINNSGMSCGADTSNVIKILVLDLPDTTEIIGYNEVCKNQQELFYSLHKTNDLYRYKWFVKKGELLTDENQSAVFINWKEVDGVDTIRVLQFNKVTFCYNYMLFPVRIKQERAPDKTQILRKSNTNILVCQDTTEGIQYQWGYIEKSNTKMNDIPNANLRYIQLSMGFDTVRYVYYVKTSLHNCPTTTFYNAYDPLIFNNVNSDKLNIEIYPNPNNGELNISGIDLHKVKIMIYNHLGQEIEYIINESKLNIINPVSGIYYIMIYDGKNKYIQKINCVN